MSATPIPRTLAAGLAGFRDLSVIATPPVHRLPVVTKVAPLSDAAIAAALLREQRRRGQSFLICPRIQDLGRCWRGSRRSRQILASSAFTEDFPPMSSMTVW